MVMGRPSKYDPKYCEELVEYMAKGYSAQAFAGHISVTEDTLHRWIRENPDLSESYKLAKSKCRDFWEGLALQHAVNKGDGVTLNTPSWIFNMKNRFGWRDRMEVENSGEVNHTGEIKHTVMTPQLHMERIQKLEEEKRKLQGVVDAELLEEKE